MSEKASVAVVGVAKNVEGSVRREFLRFQKVLEEFEFKGMYVVESDSQDNSIAVLEELAKKYSKFIYTSLGKLEPILPNRIERIRFCRNRYVSEIRQNIIFLKTDFIIVADLDNINSFLRKSDLTSALTQSSFTWTGLFPNQLINYYDLLALRSRNWLKTDFNYLIWRAYSISSRKNEIASILDKLRYELIRQKFFKRKCLRIKHNQHPIKVESAFGGLGIYKAEIFLECDYGGGTGVLSNECEHVEFHRQAGNLGKEFFLLPSLYNNLVSRHTFRKYLLCRILFNLGRKMVF